MCVDGKITSCQCQRSKCRWGETDMSCYDGSSDNNSTAIFLHEDISSALNTPSSCLRINCNCLAHGNQIAQQPASSFQDCGKHAFHILEALIIYYIFFQLPCVTTSSQLVRTGLMFHHSQLASSSQIATISDVVFLLTVGLVDQDTVQVCCKEAELLKLDLSFFFLFR